MSIKEYFSKDPNKRAKFIFNFIAPIYGKVDDGLIKTFSNTIDIVDSVIEIDGKHVLDIGTGTGAWAALFKAKGAEEVHGIDISNKMIKQGRERHNEVTFSIGNAENLIGIPDNSFDVVTASFVLHGVKKERRIEILEEMNRISKEHIVIQDFSGSTPIFIRLLEFMERSDYKNFKTEFCNELKSVFADVEKIDSSYGRGLYFASTYFDKSK